MIWKYRHRLVFDLRGIANRQHKQIVQDALNALDAPMYRIRKATGRRVPVTVRDLSRMLEGIEISDDHHHPDHSHGFHALTEPENRKAALGLYWLPTRAWPAGRVELEVTIMGNVALAQEVLIAEAAHAFDLCAMTDAQRALIFAVVHHGDPSPHGDHGWWEERGSQDYWAWLGETFMGLFMRAFAPTLPRPLEARQPWVHRTDDAMAAEVRRILVPPKIRRKPKLGAAT